MRKKGTDGLPHIWVPTGLADGLNSRDEGWHGGFLATALSMGPLPEMWTLGEGKSG